jgi:homoserine dehydrogenase
MKPGNLGDQPITGWCQFLQRFKPLKDKKNVFRMTTLFLSLWKGVFILGGRGGTMEKVNVALLGLGTVGSGVWKMLKENQDVIARKTGKWYQVHAILVKDPGKKRDLEIMDARITTDFSQVLTEETDVLVEVMGGVEPAYSYIKQAMKKGCHVVTANKELIAKHGMELEQLAKQCQVQLRYEASVGGGIPVISTLRHFLKANRIDRIQGILNGTTNYILTQMQEKGRSFAEVLKKAQEKGYAESDPSSDVEGLDAVYKLTILMRLAFQAQVSVSDIFYQGITDMLPGELQLAEKLGYSVKLLAQAEKFGENGPVSGSVLPTLVPKEHPLASVRDVYNAVTVEGDYVQDLTLVGQGAGQKPTASAVVEDLLNTNGFAEQNPLPVKEPWMLSGDDLFPTRFLLLKVRGQVTESTLPPSFPEEASSLALLPAEEHTFIGLILRGWTQEKTDALVSTWDGKVDGIRIRPVLSGEATGSKRSLPLARTM